MLLAFVALIAQRQVLAGDLIISEFMAINQTGIVDEDGETSDWIEIKNVSEDPVDTDGWYLTDDASDLDKWLMPSTIVQPGGFLLVFASGKDRAPANGEWHTNFGLAGDGDYLAVVEPDAETVSFDYGNEYPSQLADFSYGVGQDLDVSPLIEDGSELRVLIPDSGALGSTWRGGAEPFDDSQWIAGESGAGYITTSPGFAVSGWTAGSVPDLATALAIADGGNPDDVENAQVIDYLGTNGNGHYPDNNPFPVAAEDNFVIEARASVIFPTAGAYTFGVQSDDGFRLEIDGQGESFSIEHAAPRGPADTLGVFDVPSAGAYELRLVYYERGGGSMCELFARRGTFGSWDAGFDLVGDVASGGLQVESEVVGGGGDLSLRSLIRTDVQDEMFDENASAYARYQFFVADPDALDNLTLRVKYDDGFVAYLNGVEVARGNAPGSPSWNSSASESRADDAALRFEDVDISSHISDLADGENILAIHGLNDASDGSDFLIHAELARIEVLSMAQSYFDEPTPGEVNGLGFSDIVNDTTFSVDRGFYVDPFDLEITTTTPGARIYFTTDGTEPSSTNGTEYDEPIRIEVSSVIRAVATKAGFIPTNIDTQTYLFLDDVVEQSHATTLAAGFPTSWGGTTPDYGLDPDVIGATDNYGGKYRATLKDDLLAIPTMSIVLDLDDMFGSRGFYTNSGSRGVAWERPASVELIHPDGRRGFQESCGIRIQGGAFRSHGLTLKHSMRLLFKGIYGATKLRYPLFGSDAADEFDTLTLRANANDAWRWGGDRSLYFRDSFGRQTVLDMGGVASHETFVHLYVNGVYWGLYNPVERPDASFGATYFGGDKDEWDSFSNNSVSHGSRAAWDTLRDLGNAGLETEEAYQAVQGNFPDGSDDPNMENYIDVDNVIDYMITNLFTGNSDWPGKNYWIGRRRGHESTGFKFYMWDSEWSIGINSSLSTNRTGVNNGVAEPYDRLRANPEFRQRFGDRLEMHTSPGGALYVDSSRPDWDPDHPERNAPAARWMKLADRIDRAIVAESARWGDQLGSGPYTRDEHWAPERDEHIRDYFPRRTEVVIGQFRGAGLYPSIDPPSFNRYGGRVDIGFPVVLAASAGTVYYTLDGSDPRLRGGGLAPSAIEGGTGNTDRLLDAGADVRVLVPGDDSVDATWTDLGFDDDTWTLGQTGVGYERSSGYEDLIETDVEDEMYNTSTTVYMRVRFQVDNPDLMTSMQLMMKYDDGFIAYINGEPVASRNAPGDPAWDSEATGQNDDSAATSFEAIDISSAIDFLEVGTNVLCIHGLNVGTGSSDLIMVPQINAATAGEEGDAIIIDETTRVRARSFLGDEWSAITETTFIIDESLPLRISEIMYHPAPGPEGSNFAENDYEFIELQNVGDQTIDLTDVRLVGGIEFDFNTSNIDTLGPGQYLVIVENMQGFESRYSTAGLNIAGEYSGRLGNDQDSLGLVGPLGEFLLLMTYDDEWEPLSDGDGFSLVIEDPLGDPDTWGEESRWRTSVELGGSPGRDDTAGVGGFQLSGDANQDARVDVSDAITLLLTLFSNRGPDLPCEGAVDSLGNRAVLDVNGDSGVDLSDSVYLLDFLFRGGPQPFGGTRCRRVETCPSGCF